MFDHQVCQREQTINRKEVLLPQTWNKDVSIAYKSPAQITLFASVTAENLFCTQHIIQYVCKFDCFFFNPYSSKISFSQIPWRLDVSSFKLDPVGSGNTSFSSAYTGRTYVFWSKGWIHLCGHSFSRGSFSRAVESKTRLKYLNSKRHTCTYRTTRCI